MKICPLTNDVVLYPTCLECEEKECRSGVKPAPASKEEDENHDN